MVRIAGMDLKTAGAARQAIGHCAPPTLIGLMGSDYPGLRLKALVEPGARVSAGQAVLADRARPDLLVAAPVAGVVDEISVGARRRVALLTLRSDGDAVHRHATREVHDEKALRVLLLTSGFWPAFLRRPFGRVPDPAEIPAAIVVGAMAALPGDPGPAPLIKDRDAAFARGLDALTLLTPGKVHLCVAPDGPPLPAGADRARLRRAVFRGGVPAGLPGTHIERLCPASPDRPVWQIGWEEVTALGTLLTTGTLPMERIVAFGGARAADPRLLRLPIGADMDELARTEAREGPRRVLSGSLLAGRESRFLRRRHSQITLVPRTDAPQAPAGRLRLGPVKQPALVPNAALARALGPDLPAIPILRALSVADGETAERLGALGLLEEDMALATYLSGGTEDFGACLRQVLDAAEAERA